MPDHSSRLSLPYLAEAQAQKHVTVNEGIRRLDALVHLSVRSAAVAEEPPASDGDAYILPAGATGASWSGRPAGTIMALQDGAWQAIAPVTGMVAYTEDEGQLRVHDGSGWAPLTEQRKLGVNTVADETNRLAVKSDAVLFSHDDTTPGTGDIRIVLNKQAEGRTASFLFQTAYGAKAEFGLTGTDDFVIKVAGDDGIFRDAIVIDRQTGAVSLPNTP